MAGPFLFSPTTTRPGTYVSPYENIIANNTRAIQRRRNEEDDERNVIERVLAPFEAPQQLLFGATKAVAGDMGVGEVFTHAIRYANPFSNEQAIDANEIREIFGGDEDAKGFKRWGANLAISLLYDPLNIVPVAKGIGLIDEAPSIFRPIANAVGAATKAGTTAAVRGAVKAGIVTEERVAVNKAWVNRMLVSKYAGLPQELTRRTQQLEQGIIGWRTKAYNVFKRAQTIGGADAQRLVGDAMEDEAFFLSRMGDEGENVKSNYRLYQDKFERLGIDEEKFLDVFDRSRALDDEIADGLQEVGVLDAAQMAELRNKHLRRKIMAYEKPVDYIDRIEALNIPDTERISKFALRQNLNSIRKELDATITKTPSDYLNNSGLRTVHPEGTTPLFQPGEAQGIVRVGSEPAERGSTATEPALLGWQTPDPVGSPPPSRVEPYSASQSVTASDTIPRTTTTTPIAGRPEPYRRVTEDSIYPPAPNYPYERIKERLAPSEYIKDPQDFTVRHVVSSASKTDQRQMREAVEDYNDMLWNNGVDNAMNAGSRTINGLDSLIDPKTIRKISWGGEKVYVADAPGMVNQVFFVRQENGSIMAVPGETLDNFIDVDAAGNAYTRPIKLSKEARESEAKRLRGTYPSNEPGTVPPISIFSNPSTPTNPADATLRQVSDTFSPPGTPTGAPTGWASVFGGRGAVERVRQGNGTWSTATDVVRDPAQVDLGKVPTVREGYKSFMDTDIAKVVQDGTANQRPPSFWEQKRGQIAGRKMTEPNNPKHYWDEARILAAEGKFGQAAQRAEEGLDVARAEKFAPEVIRTFNQFLGDIKGSTASISRTDATGAVSINKYFKDGNNVRFNSRVFADDVDQYLRSTPTATTEEVFDHIQNVMFEGTNMPASFWKTIGGYLSETGEKIPGILDKSKVTVRGSQYYADKLREMRVSPGVQWHSFNEKLQVVARREEIPPEILAEMGEVREFGPRLAAQASEAGRLLEMRKFFDDIGGVVRDPNDPTTILEKRGSRIASPTREGIKGPAVQLNGTHLGAVDGMWVQPSVALFLQHMEGNGVPAQPTARVWQKVGDHIADATGLFKVFKTVVDPAAQVRNFIGSMVQMDLGGTHSYRVDRLVKSAGELIQLGKTGKPGKYLQLAEEAGVTMFQHTFSRQELGRYAEALSEAKWSDKKGIYGALENVFRGMGRAAPAGMNAAIEAFEFQEKMFKLNVFIEKYENIMTKAAKKGTLITPDMQKSVALQAGEMADQALFNYADVPVLVDFARKYGVVPFITFPFKAIPFAAKTLIDHPHRILKYHRGAEGWNDAVAGSPEEAEREIAALPSYMRDKLVAKLPWQDAKGRDQYADLSFFMPWYTIQELSKGFKNEEGKDALIPQGNPLVNNPIMSVINAVTRNEDGLGRPIVTDDMDEIEKARAVGDYFWQYIVPPDAPGGSRAASIGRAIKAITTDNPEAQNWGTRLAQNVLLAGGGEGKGLTSAGLRPQSQSQVGGSGLGALFGLEPDSAGNIMGGVVEGLASFSAVASDPVQTGINRTAQRDAVVNDIVRQIARVRSNPNLPIAEKIERINRLMAQQQEALEQFQEDMSAMY